jgi:hypothetical protein
MNIVLPPMKGITVDLPEGVLSQKQFEELDNKYHRRCEFFSKIFGPDPNFHYELVDRCKVPVKCSLADDGQRLELQFENGRKACEDDFDTGDVYEYALRRERLGLDYVLKMFKYIKKESEAAKMPVPKMKIVCYDKLKKEIWTCDPADLV